MHESLCGNWLTCPSAAAVIFGHFAARINPCPDEKQTLPRRLIRGWIGDSGEGLAIQRQPKKKVFQLGEILENPQAFRRPTEFSLYSPILRLSVLR